MCIRDRVWAELEDYIVELTGKDGARQSLLRSLNFIKEKSMVHPRVLKDIDTLRRFRNKMVHSPHSVKDDEISVYFRLLLDVRGRLYRNDS